MRRRVCFLVRVEGLEPPCLAALDPKSSASTNFATPALKTDCKCRENIYYSNRQIVKVASI